MGASIPNIRPGEETNHYLTKIIKRLTFLGSIFLFIVALVPSIIAQLTQLNTFKGLGATSLLILVGVAIDTAKQIQTYLISCLLYTSPSPRARPRARMPSSA